MTENMDLIVYCGLYCGDCFNYKGEIADLARDLSATIKLLNVFAENAGNEAPVW